MEIIYLLGTAMGLGFVSGINLYATVMTIGFGLQAGWIQLAPEMAALHDLAHPMILTAATAGYLAEFFADKIPWVDSLWDTVHTLVRPLAATLIGVRAIGTTDPVMELFVILLCGGIALSTHASKAGLRLVVNTSPEPFSNIGLSLAEDVVAVAGVWAALQHPLFCLVSVIGFTALFLILAPRLFRLLRLEAIAAGALLRRMTGSRTPADDTMLFDPVAGSLYPVIHQGREPLAPSFCVRAAAGKGVGTRRNAVGYLYASGDRLFFAAGKWSGYEKHELGAIDSLDARLVQKLLVDRILVNGAGGQQQVLLFKAVHGRSERIADLLKGGIQPGGSTPFTPLLKA